MRDRRKRVREFVASVTGLDAAMDLAHRNAALETRLWEEDRNRAALLHLLEELELEHRQVEEARREWVQTLDAIADPVFVHDADDRILRANRAYAERAGCDVADTLGRVYWEVFPQRSGPLSLCNIDYVDGQDAVTKEFSLDSGEIFISRAFVIRDDNQGFRYAVHVLVDVTQQRRSEAERRLFSAALRQSSAGLILLNSDMSFRYVNPAASALVGYESGQLDGLPLAKVVPGHLAERIPIIKQAVDAARQWEGEVVLQARDGSQIPAYLAAAIISDGSDKVSTYVGSWIDLRPIRQAQQDLAVSEARFRLLTENASDLVAVTSVDGMLLYVSPSVQRLLGYEPEEVVGHPVADFLYPEEVDMVMEAVNYSLAEEPSTQGKIHRLRCKDGSWRYFETLVRNLLHEPAVAGIVFNARDVTERRRAERALRASEQDMNAIVENLPLMVFAKDAQQLRFVRFNRAAEELLGVPRANMLGKSDRDFFPPEQAELFLGKDRETLATGEGVDIPEEVIDTPHGQRILHTRKVVVRAPDGQARYLLGISEDITEQKQQQQHLQRANRALRALSACNAILIHAETESQLLADMCRVVVAESGYRAAWAGYRVPGNDAVVRPMAAAGEEDGSVETVQFTWDDSDAQWGLDGRVLPAEQPVIVRNIQADPEYIQADPQWVSMHEQAVKGGYDSFVALPLRRNGGEALGVFYIYATESTAFDEEEVRLLVEMADNLAFGIVTLRARAERDRLQWEHLKAAERLKDTLTETIRAIALMVEKRDPFTAGHQHKVADLSMAIGRVLGMDEDRLEGLRLGATIHDIGKIYVPAEILNRPGALTAAEFQVVKSHCQVGYDIVKDVKFPWPVAQMILQHQERLDGSGYPNGVKGEDILLEARIIAVADVVEAMSSHRPYRPALAMDVVLAEIEANRGKLYDPAVVDACLRLMREQDFHFVQTGEL
jgi:PAS domain S-box-containing protein